MLFSNQKEWSADTYSWVNFKNIMLSERSWIVTYYMILFIQDIQNSKSIEKESWLVLARGFGIGKNGMWFLNGYKALFWGVINILELDMCKYIINVLTSTVLFHFKIVSFNIWISLKLKILMWKKKWSTLRTWKNTGLVYSVAIAYFKGLNFAAKFCMIYVSRI